MEAIDWVCASVWDNHDWISEVSLVLQGIRILEAPDYGTQVPCRVQWWPLWYSAPSSLSNDLLNDDVMLEMYNWVINVLQVSFHTDTNAKVLIFEGTKIDDGHLD